MAAGYYRMFWGLLIMSFHINIGRLRILPPFVGWLVIREGVGLLYNETQNPKFIEAKKFLLAITILSVLSEIVTFFSAGLPGSSLILVIWTVVHFVLELLSFFKILEGSIDVLELQGRMDFVDKYINKQRIYIILSMINIAFIILSMIYGILWSKVASVIVAVGIKIHLLMMMAELEKLHKPEEPEII